MFSNQDYPKKPILFSCKICDFNTSNKKDYTRHINTVKHFVNEKQTSSIEKTPKNPFECICGKVYKDYSGLWRHKKKCNVQETATNEIQELKDFMKYLMKENSEMKTIMMEMVKNGINSNNNNSNNTNNSNNKTFNLNVFLNETCKDAMNIMDFVESLQVQIGDFENVGKLGYVEGISNIIVKNLKALDVEKRPVHCTDVKREIFYVKDNDKWEKEDEDNKKIRKFIKKIAFKNQRLLTKFKELHPDCITSASCFSDQYNKLIIESCGGSGDNDLEKEDKIIRNISKQVLIEKNKYCN